MLWTFIAEAKLLGAKPSNVPIEHNHCLALTADFLFPHPDQYRRLVGHLIYLCFTRPKLSYCVDVMSQFMQASKEAHWEAALRVVRYLKGNPGQGVLLRKDCDLQLPGWSDSDWVGRPLTRRE